MVNTSVIIPCHNSANTLDLQLECLAAQISAEEFEVIAVDNKSTDNTVEVLKRWQDRLNLKIVPAFEHAGVSYARNVGVRESQGEKLIFIDSDDAIPERYISDCQRSLDEVPVCMTGFDPVESQEFELGRERVLQLISSKILDYKSPIEHPQDAEWPILPGGAFAIRRDSFYEIGGFDLATEPGAEDNDFAIRLFEKGYQLPIQQSTTIAYRIDSQYQKPLKTYYHRAKSVALLTSYSNNWDYRIRKSGNPLIQEIRAVLAVVTIIGKKQHHRMAWKTRIATTSGIFIGYLQYEIFKHKPKRKIGFGAR